MWNVVCVCVCPTASVFPRPLSFACERTWKTAGERKFETEEEGGGRGQSSLKSCLSTCVFIVTFHFSSNSAQFPSQVHVCQRLLLSFVQPRCAWSNHYLSSLYIYYFIVNSSGVFVLCQRLCVFFVQPPAPFPFIDTNQSPQLSCAFCKGLSLDITVCWCNSRISASHRHPQKFLKSLFYKKKSNTHTEKKSVWLYWSFVVLLLFGKGKKKNNLHDPTVFPELLYIPFVNTLWMYSTVPNYYWHLHGTACLSVTTHTH